MSYVPTHVATTLYCSNCGSPTPSDAAMCARCGAILPGPAPVAHLPAVAQPRYAGFWIRFVAAFLDGLLVQVVVMPAAFILGAVIGAAGLAVSMPDPGTELVAMIGGFTLGSIASWLYGAVMESSKKQATFGKMLLGLQVTDEAGQRISFARASGRHFAKYISTVILFIGYIMAGFTERKQALHDMIAGTLVVKK